MDAAVTDHRKIGGRFMEARHIFKVVLQVVFLFGLDTWVVKPFIGRIIGGFYHRFSRRLTGRHPRRKTYGIWYYPPLK